MDRSLYEAEHTPHALALFYQKLAENLTGTTYYVLVGDPLDRDSDYYRITQGQDRWWSTDDNDPIHGQLFMQSRAGVFLNTGRLSIVTRG